MIEDENSWSSERQGSIYLLYLCYALFRAILAGQVEVRNSRSGALIQALACWTTSTFSFYLHMY